MSEIKKYMHSRKGLIVGKIIKDDGEWVTIEFSKDQVIKYSGGNEGVENGQTMTVRKAFLKEVK